MLVDCRSKYTARAVNQDTGDEVYVTVAIPDFPRFVYRLNGGPWQDIPRHIQDMGTNPTKMAMTLLRARRAMPSQ